MNLKGVTDLNRDSDAGPAVPSAGLSSSCDRRVPDCRRGVPDCLRGRRAVAVTQARNNYEPGFNSADTVLAAARDGDSVVSHGHGDSEIPARRPGAGPGDPAGGAGSQPGRTVANQFASHSRGDHDKLENVATSPSRYSSYSLVT